MEKQIMKEQIEEIFKNPESLQTQSNLVEKVISRLNEGQLRVCEYLNGKWQVNQWVKKAILLYFRYRKMEPVHSGPFSYFDKIPIKQWDSKSKVRVVPQALARYGSFVDEGAILMPSYINIGAFVGKESLVDTWVTVGSCAYVGKRVHLSGGVGIGGVLEPLQARPVIVEEGCFIGSRSILVEGVHVEKFSVIGAGVTITGSTKILDVSGSVKKEYKGFVPTGSVVIPGSLTKEFPRRQVQCALCPDYRKAKNLNR